MENNSDNNSDSFENFLAEIQSDDSAKKSLEIAAKSKEEKPSPADMKLQSASEESFNSLVERCNEIVKGLPFDGQSDYEIVKAKLAENKIHYDESPSPSELSNQLGLVQMMKDELLEISARAYYNHIVRKRIYEILFDAYMSISQKTSADKRKGDATLRLSAFSLNAVDAEAFYVYCKQIADNLESSHKTISRRIVCMQAQISLGEMPTAGPDVARLDAQKRALVQGQRKNLRENSEPSEVEWDKDEELGC